MKTLAALVAVAGVVLLAVVSPAAAQAQPPPPAQGPELPAGRPISAGEIQRLFDAYMMIQAQEALKLSEAQYGRFVTRLKALQDTRRRHQQTRNQILADLRRLSNPETGTSDETLITERLKAFRDEEERGAGELRKAYDALDESLDVRQQARFRLFEEQMERRKVELLMRARQANRPRQQF